MTLTLEVGDNRFPSHGRGWLAEKASDGNVDRHGFGDGSWWWEPRSLTLS